MYVLRRSGESWEVRRYSENLKGHILIFNTTQSSSKPGRAFAHTGGSFAEEVFWLPFQLLSCVSLHFGPEK